MAKMTFSNGVVIEGTVEELAEMTERFSEVEAEPFISIEEGTYVTVIDDEVSDFVNGEVLQVIDVDTLDDCCPYLAENSFGEQEWMSASEITIATYAEATLYQQQLVVKQLEDDLQDLYELKEDLERDINRTEHALFEVMK